MYCITCEKIGFSKSNFITQTPKKSIDNYDFLSILISHIKDEINIEMFDDENHINKHFQRLILHCTVKGTKIHGKKELANEYKERLKDGSIEQNQIFEQLVFEITNGELCISVPSKALDSCPFNCAFCPTSNESNKSTNKSSESNESTNKSNTLNIAKSYTLGQPVFAKLIKNNNNLIKYLLQHIIHLYSISTNISKLAMRHLGGTFSTYPKLYRYEYSRDIFYAVNILPLIIENTELLNLAKQSLINLFDPDNIIINQLRKPFNLKYFQYDMNISPRSSL